MISTPVWIGGGVLCMMCLQQRYHSIWTNGIWLISAYFLTAAGTVLFFVMYDFGYWWYLTAIVLLLLAVSMLYWMILEIYTLRSRIIDTYPEEEERMEMGEWAILLPIFLLMTIISYYYYSKWFLGEEGWFTFGMAANGYLLTQIMIFVVKYRGSDGLEGGVRAIHWNIDHSSREASAERRGGAPGIQSQFHGDFFITILFSIN